MCKFARSCVITRNYCALFVLATLGLWARSSSFGVQSGASDISVYICQNVWNRERERKMEPKSVVNVGRLYLLCCPSLLVAGSSPAIMLLKILMQRLRWRWGGGCGGAPPRPRPAYVHPLGVILCSDSLAPSSSARCTVANCCHFPYPIHWSVRFQRSPEVCSAWLGLHFPASCAVFCLLPSVLSRYIYIALYTKNQGAWLASHFLLRGPVLCKCISMFLPWLILKVHKHLVLSGKMRNIFYWIRLRNSKVLLFAYWASANKK